LKKEILRELQKNGVGGKPGKPAEKVNAVQFRSLASETDEELKKRGWPPKKIEALHKGNCFNCFEEGHRSADCPKKKKPTPTSN
jgi:hypothetical protein